MDKHPKKYKKEFSGSFNYQGELWVGNTNARHEEQAFHKLLYAMSKKYLVTPSRLVNYFRNKPNSYTIKAL